MGLFGRRRGRGKARDVSLSSVEVRVDSELRKILEYFMESEGVSSTSEAVTRLVKMGYKYWNMRSQYGDDLSDRELWDIRFRLLKLESGYLHYKLMLRDALEQLRTLTMNLSSALSQLNTCLARLKDADPNANVDLEDAERYKRVLEEYSKKFIFSAKEEIESGQCGGISDEEIIRDIENLLHLYKEKLGTHGKGFKSHEVSQKNT